MTVPVALALVGIYAVVLLAVGAAFTSGQDSSESYLLADRTLGPARVFASTFATFYGTGINVTFAAMGYQYGVGAFGLPLAAVLGFVPLALAAPRIKALSDRQGAITLPGLMAGSWRPRTRALAALVTGALFAIALAVNLLAAGTALEELLGVPAAGALAFGLLVVTYTTLGGFRAVVWTDVVQTALVMIGILVALPATVLLTAGPEVLEGLPGGHLDPLTMPVPIVLVYLVAGVFTFFGSQDVFQRVFAARSEQAARRGLLLFTGSLAVVGPIAVALGIAGRALVPAAAPDGVLFALAGDPIPAWAVGIVLLGVLALANSDADSQLLTVTSTITQDFLPYLDLELSQAERIWANRIVVVGLGTIAVGIAALVPDFVALFGGLGTFFAILGVAVIGTLFWDATTDLAAFLSIAMGILSAILVLVSTGTIRMAPIVALVAAVATLVVISIYQERLPTPRLPVSH